MPTTPVLSGTYPTDLDPATADLWGAILNTLFLLFDAEFGTRTVNQNCADKIFSRITLKDEATEVYVHGNVSGAVTVDFTNGNIQSMTLTGNVTLTLNNPCPTGDFGYFTLLVTQDATGGRTVTFPASCKNTSGSTFSISGTTASKMTEIFGYTLDTGTLYRTRQGATWG